MTLATGLPPTSDSVIVRRVRSQAGTASLVLPMLLWVATLVAIVVVDVGAYLVAAARGQALADAAALAAVSVDATIPATGSPHREATRVVTAGQGQLERCDCRPGAGRATVTASVEVPGLVLPRLGARRVDASASAVLAPPDDLTPGPTRERAGWAWSWPTAFRADAAQPSPTVEE